VLLRTVPADAVQGERRLYRGAIDVDLARRRSSESGAGYALLARNEIGRDNADPLFLTG